MTKFYNANNVCAAVFDGYNVIPFRSVPVTG